MRNIGKQLEICKEKGIQMQGNGLRNVKKQTEKCSEIVKYT